MIDDAISLQYRSRTSAQPCCPEYAEAPRAFLAPILPKFPELLYSSAINIHRACTAMSDETTKPGAPSTKEAAESTANVENQGPAAPALPGSALSVLSDVDKTILRLNKYEVTGNEFESEC
jgi:hypothetical protein